MATCPSFIPLNAALVVCRTSRQRERDHPHHGGRNSDHCQRCLAWSWPLVLRAVRSFCRVDPLGNRTSPCPLLGVKRTLVGDAAMSAFDPKRTSGASWGSPARVSGSNIDLNQITGCGG